MQTHRNLLQLICNYTNSIGITHSDRFSLLPSLGFAAALMDIYGALLNGASLHLYDVRQDGLLSLPDWMAHTVFRSTIRYRPFFDTLQGICRRQRIS